MALSTSSSTASSSDSSPVVSSAGTIESKVEMKKKNKKPKLSIVVRELSGMDQIALKLFHDKCLSPLSILVHSPDIVMTITKPNTLEWMILEEKKGGGGHIHVSGEGELLAIVTPLAPRKWQTRAKKTPRGVMPLECWRWAHALPHPETLACNPSPAILYNHPDMHWMNYPYVGVPSKSSLGLVLMAHAAERRGYVAVVEPTLGTTSTVIGVKKWSKVEPPRSISSTLAASLRAVRKMSSTPVPGQPLPPHVHYQKVEL